MKNIQKDCTLLYHKPTSALGGSLLVPVRWHIVLHILYCCVQCVLCFVRCITVCNVYCVAHIVLLCTHTTYMTLHTQPMCSCFATCACLRMCRVGQNHIHTAYIRYFWLENHQIYGVYIRIYTVLANPMYVLLQSSNAV